jgi:hypothetical protein
MRWAGWEGRWARYETELVSPVGWVGSSGATVLFSTLHEATRELTWLWCHKRLILTTTHRETSCKMHPWEAVCVCHCGRTARSSQTNSSPHQTHAGVTVQVPGHSSQPPTLLLCSSPMFRLMPLRSLWRLHVKKSHTGIEPWSLCHCLEEILPHGALNFIWARICLLLG